MPSINYEDERFTEVEQEKQEALSETEKTYGGMISESDKYYDAQIEASRDYAEQQKQNQQAQTDFAIEKIEQQKEQAEKDYTKEQSGAYIDWQKQSNQYGANAEQMASAGMTGTGYSESSQVSMYNTYQNRVATARESYNRAILNYDNSIKEAILQNSSILAEIAYNALQKELELALQGFQYKNQLIIQMANKKQEIDNTYYGRYQDVLQQINTENALAEEIRQYNETKALQEKQMAQEQANWEKEYSLQQQQLAEEKRQFNASLNASRSSGGSSRSSSSGSSSSSKSSKSSSSSKKVSSSKHTPALTTEYYRGAVNSDVEKYGAFSNGYQPKGITGHGKLKKTGKTIQLSTQTLSGKKQQVVQNVWQAEDGTLWYWEGRENRYIQIK